MTTPEILQFAIPLFTGLLGWIAGKRKSNAQIVSIELKNAREVIDMQSSYIKRLIKQIEDLELKLNSLEKRVNELTTTKK